MAPEIKREVTLEIVHVLFLDIVGYSKALTDEQQQLVDRLNQVVRGSEEFREAADADRLIKIPTGDGMALIFYNSPEQPVNCALEVSRALKNSSLPLRMGVHSGPVSAVTDLNERTNAAGVGINIAQRVMDCGDTGHILLSKRVAEDLQQYSRWRPHLHDLGEVEVKHGERVHVFNFYTDDAGNSDLPKKVIGAAVQSRRVTVAPAKKPAKSERPSICVLPFANMSGDPEEEKAIEQRGTENVNAYNLFLMARQTYATGFEGDPRRLDAIVRMCQRAVEIDPNYADAWALIALAEVLLRANVGRKGGDAGLAAAERALALNPDLAEAHAVKARILSEENRNEEAAREIDIALRLDPESYQVNRSAGLLRFRQKQIEEAAGHWEKTLTLEEDDFGSAGMLITVYTALGKPEAAQRAAKIALERCEKTLSRDSNNAAAMGHSAVALAMLGQHERAKEWMERALLIDPDNLTSRYNFVCALANYLHEKDAALEMLRPMLEQMSGF